MTAADAGPPDVVPDCVVLLQAAMNPDGPAGRCVRAAYEGRLTLHVSRATLRELRDVLDYPAIRARSPRLTDEAAAEFVERVRWRAVYHRVVPHAVDLPRDPKDEPYLDLAVHAGADLLATRDGDLLALADGRDEPARRLRRLVPSLRIVTPETLAAELGA